MARRLLGRAKRRWTDNIKIGCIEIGREAMHWITLAQDSGKWWALVNVVMRLRFP